MKIGFLESLDLPNARIRQIKMEIGTIATAIEKDCWLRKNKFPHSFNTFRWFSMETPTGRTYFLKETPKEPNGRPFGS